MKNHLFLLVAFVLVAGACRNRNVTPAYQARKTEHKLIAILPIESVYTGKIPPEVTAEEIAMIEDAHSLRFQELVYSTLLSNSGIRRRDIGIDFMSTSVLNHKLEAMGISAREASTMNVITLADSLGADVVIRGYVQMNRFLSDLQSFQIDIAENVVRSVISNVGIPVPLPGNIGSFKRTYTIESGLEALAIQDGAVMWKIASFRNADWSYQPEQAIYSLAWQFADEFPYRNRELRNR